MKIGYHNAELKFEKKPIPFLWKILGNLAEWSLFSKLRDQLGLSYVRHAYTGGAAMGPDHFRFFLVARSNESGRLVSSETWLRDQAWPHWG